MMIAFGPPLAVFLFIVVSDSLRIILFVGGAFFWLLSVLVTSLLWYVIKPLQNSIVSLILLIVFEELFRFVYYFVIRKAESGIEKITTSGHSVAVQVHSLKHSRHAVALVCGLGFGVMCGAVLLINVLADSWGPGTVGLPASMDLIHNTGTYLLFLTSVVVSKTGILAYPQFYARLIICDHLRVFEVPKIMLICYLWCRA
ncbi:unnamed protein product [Soboliphyme baturini]|uniref:Gamma-secretase subunit Aph-1 n=1 Tax=Soboliphyme baturini TaxID=241478 RepID=A0A183IA86_9BILA|nr:unnamed protein product [Soboliphyme baturini]